VIEDKSAVNEDADEILLQDQLTEKEQYRSICELWWQMQQRIASVVSLQLTTMFSQNTPSQVC